MKGRFCVFALAEFLEGLEASATRYFVSHLTNDYNCMCPYFCRSCYVLLFFCRHVDIMDVTVGILLIDKSIDKPIRAGHQSGCSTLK